MTVREQLNSIAQQRILILDGAMGSMIQSQKPVEADFRGKRFANHTKPLLGCNDLLCLSKPEIITGIHEAYLAAGADIIETCSFNSTAVSLADYGLVEGCLAYEISAAAARLARTAADTFSTADKPRFVAGSIGPTAKSAGIPADINNPAGRAIYWDELEAAYYDNVRGLLDGGADILLLETIFDTLNAKAALCTISRLIEERRIDIPIMISATVSGDSGRLLSGQTLEAFYESVRHSEPWAIGLNCSFGAEKLMPHIRRFAGLPCLVSAHPNAGLPNHSGGYDETPETMAASIEPYLRDGLLNIIGGCCGSTPAHIAAIAEKAALYKNTPPQAAGYFRSPEELQSGFNQEGRGIKPLRTNKPRNLPKPFPPDAAPVTNAAGIKIAGNTEEDFEDAIDSACDLIDDGADILKISIDESLPDAEKTIAAFLDYALFNPNIAKTPIMIDSFRWDIIESALKHLPGKCFVKANNLKSNEAALVKRYGATIENGE